MILTLEIPAELSEQIERAAQKRGIGAQRFVLEAIDWVLSNQEHDLFDDLAHERSLRDVQGLPPFSSE